MSEVSARTQQKLVLALMVLALIGCAFWLFGLLEWEEQEIDLGYSDEARRNPFLAAQQLLERRHMEVRVLNSLSVFEAMAYKNTAIGSNDLVVLVNAHRALQNRHAEKLLGWIDAGGSLVISTHNSFIDTEVPGEDPLLRHLPVSLALALQSDAEHESGQDLDARGAKAGGTEQGSGQYQPASSTSDGPSTHASADAIKKASAEPSTEPSTDPLAEGAATADEDHCALLTRTSRIQGQLPIAFEIGHLRGLPLIPDHDLAIEWRDAKPPHRLLRFSQGKGAITLNTDNNIWNNRYIGCLDHAYALALLAQGRNTVWFVLNTEAPAFWRLLWNNAPFAMLALMLAFLFWLWARVKRFAPAVPTKKIARRSFLEHAHASAIFLWRNKQQRQLIAQLRRDVLQAYGRRFPGFAETSDTEKIELISVTSGLSPAEVDVGVLQPPSAKARDFTLIINRLQHIRNSL